MLLLRPWGLKWSDNGWMAQDVRKMLDCGDGKWIGQRWMRGQEEMCISICLHIMCLSASISLCLSLSGLERAGRHTSLLTPPDWTEGRSEQERARQQGFTAATLSCSAGGSVRIAYCSGLARPLTHYSNYTYIFALCTQTVMQLLAVSKMDTICSHLFRDHLLHSDAQQPFSIPPVREIKRWGGGMKGGQEREGRGAVDGEYFCIVSRNIVLCMQGFLWCCHIVWACVCKCVCLFVFFLGCILPYLSIGMNLTCHSFVCMCVCACDVLRCIRPVCGHVDCLF